MNKGVLLVCCGVFLIFLVFLMPSMIKDIKIGKEKMLGTLESDTIFMNGYNAGIQDYQVVGRGANAERVFCDRFSEKADYLKENGLIPDTLTYDCSKFK